MVRLRIYCPAKVNLGLAVGAPDARGYHPLRTVFQAVGLFDILEVEFGDQPAQSTTFDVDGADIPAENTVAKALRLSREIFAVQPHRVRLEKKIPMQSGLGGGSSDAAGILRALQAFSIPNTQPPIPGVASVAAAVGSDVPFFLTGGKALGEGYGEKITPMADAGEEWFLIAKPAIGCSTAEMYAKLDEGRLWSDLSDLSPGEPYNDFEKVAPRECLDLIERLRVCGAGDAALCGSGSAAYGRFPTRKEALAARDRLDAEAWVAKSLTRAESLRIERF